MSELEKIEKEIESLLRKREQILEDKCDRFFLYDYKKGVEKEFIVLSPRYGERDIKLIQDYIDSLKTRGRADLLQQWLNEYTVNRCVQEEKRNCERMESPICCIYCSHYNLCLEDNSPGLCNWSVIGERCDE